MNFVNLTAHALTVRTPAGDYTFPPSGTVARLPSEDIPDGVIDGIPVVHTAYGEPAGIPEPVEGTAYLVSALVAQRCTRADVYAPDTGPASVVRDDAGRIIAVRRLLRY